MFLKCNHHHSKINQGCTTRTWHRRGSDIAPALRVYRLHTCMCLKNKNHFQNNVPRCTMCTWHHCCSGKLPQSLPYHQSRCNCYRCTPIPCYLLHTYPRCIVCTRYLGNRQSPGILIHKQCIGRHFCNAPCRTMRTWHRRSSDKTYPSQETR